MFRELSSNYIQGLHGKSPNLCIFGLPRKEKNKAKKGYNKKSSKGWNMMNTTTQRAGYNYEV